MKLTAFIPGRVHRKTSSIYNPSLFEEDEIIFREIEGCRSLKIRCRYNRQDGIRVHECAKSLQGMHNRHAGEMFIKISL